MMITFEKLTKAHETSILDIQLSENHVKFASTPQAFLSDSTPHIDKVVVRYKGDVIGFFKLDLNYSEYFDFCSSNALGFRTLALDTRMQGKGLGTECMKRLATYVASNYAMRDYIYLTVNCKNTGAKVCYEKAGFEDTGKLYLNGPAGPQHIMRRKVA
ncbi:GNAT family N-acetyltransferase [Vibrio sp. STUT-A11]|uniref:GNAT family N-acetyltransferase n=1 Tax=Vibrio sp. STUT-A11 TaxID=2976236 RepID=UPI00222E28CC|nr:GNAT family N-acetyltransferase [Vibrio sp. STUT-A11]